jgi:hypothetical protein
MDSSGRFVVVTASSGAAPFDLKLWVYEPPKVSAASQICDILTPTFKASTFSKKLLASPTVAPFSTWRDRIIIAFVAFLSMLPLILILLLVVKVVMPDLFFTLRA